MRTIITLLAVTILAMSAASAATPLTPYEGLVDPVMEKGILAPSKAPIATDLKTAALMGADYVLKMQADVNDDTAGNGEPDNDPNDGGWDWNSTIFEHSANASSTNLYGATIQGVLRAYALDPKPAYLTAMTDAADQMIAIGPYPTSGVRSAADVIFLLNFADLADCPAPATYRAGAQTIWDRHIATYGTMQALAEAIRDGRAGQGYANAIIAWDIGAWAEAAMLMHVAFPTGGHADEGEDIAQVLYDDSIALSPYGYFDVYGRNAGYDPTYSNTDYYWYTTGVTGLIQAFATTGAHTEEIPNLQAQLLACQCPSGAFSYQYGGTDGDEDDQGTAYALLGLVDHLPLTTTTAPALYDGAVWLSTVQDASGGIVYSTGTHYPEIGGECAAGMVAAYLNSTPTLTPVLSDDGPITCDEYQTVTFRYTPDVASPAMRGYEITFAVTGAVAYTGANINDSGDLAAIGTHAYYEVDNGTSWTVTDALLGTTPGVTAEADLFTVLLDPTAEGMVTVEILDYRMRTLDNADIFAELEGAEFEVDCTAPLAVWNIDATTFHHRVEVTWDADETDVDHYEVYRGLRYDSATGDSSYPEYDDLAGDTTPVRPGDRAAAVASPDWVLAGTSPVGTLYFNDTFMVDRGVYWYEVYAVDTTPHYSPAAPAYDGALNYWLGDVEIPYNGYVNSGDITQLGANFGLTDGDGYNNEIDVGPTSDASGTGFPETDNVIDFEDLMIFALNYGNVDPAKKLPSFDRTPPVFAWTHAENGDWVLTLSESCAALKGLRLRAALPEGVNATVTPGVLLGQQVDPVFLRETGDLDVCLAVMGTGRGLTGSGEVLRVSLSGDVESIVPEIDARALDNAKLDDSTTGGAAQLPTAFAVRPNYPNPFNPSTTICFDLPDTRRVQVGVYALDGQLVKMLKNEELVAGTHEVVWNGLDTRGHQVASGTYLFRVDAGKASSTHKMLLVK